MPRDGGAWDTGLEYAGGQPKFYNLATDENGLMMWHEGYVPAFVQQQNNGALTSSALPADLSVLITFEDWSGGAGRVNAPPGEASPNRYSYSRGIDASWGDRLYLSPEKQALTGITGTVIKFYTSPTFGEYALASASGSTTTARRVYQFSGGSWVERYDAGSDIVTDIVEYGNTVDVYLVLARGDANDIVYSIDGTSFALTSTGNQATFLGVRGHTALNPVLVGVSATGEVAQATAIGTFTAADQVGSAGEACTGLEVANDLMVIFKAGGVYTFDGVDVRLKLASNALYRPTNGRAHCTFNGWVYFNFDNRVVEYDPFEDTFATVYFPEHPELNGDVTALVATTTHVYFGLTNSAGAVYVMKGHPKVGAWHTLSYRTTQTIAALHVVRNGAIHSTNDVLLFDGGSETGYFILAQDGLRPEDDTAYRFQTTQGHIYGPLTDGGVMAMVKRLNGVRAIGENATASNIMAISYGVDMVDTSPTAGLTVNEDGLAEARITADTPFTRIHYYATMNSAGREVSPRLLSIVFDVTPYPQRRRRFDFTVALEFKPGKGLARRAGLPAYRRHLIGAMDEQVTLTSPFRETFIGKVQAVESLGFKLNPEAGQGYASTATALYRVVFEEITETTDDNAVMVWDQSTWNDGNVWDD